MMSGIPLRSFNEEGIVRFRECLQRMRDGEAADPRLDLLDDDKLGQLWDPRTNLDRPALQTKRDAAEHLGRALDPLPRERILANAGLWTWLTLFHFDDVCPPVGGHRRVLNDYHYVYEPHHGLHHYRHLLSISYRIYCLAPRHNRLVLDTPLCRLGSVTESIARQLKLLRIPCMFEVLDRLYYDEVNRRAKKGIVDPRPRAGDLRNRLPVRIRQLQKTYDLHVLSADKLIQLLGPEFRRWFSTEPMQPQARLEH